MSNWQKEREMTARQYKLAIKTLGMTISGAGRFLGASPRTAFRYASGGAKLRADTVMLLRKMIHDGEVPLVPPVPDDE